jgi:hypothetical protein
VGTNLRLVRSVSRNAPTELTGLRTMFLSQGQRTITPPLAGGYFMKHTIGAILFASFMAMGVQALADDAPSSANANNSNQAMKDCMAKQKATNSSMTQDAMKTVCKNEAKKHKDNDGNDLATGIQAPNQH